MGRGRQKAKQTKVARELKYFSPETDYNALQRELHGPDRFSPAGRNTAPVVPEPEAEEDEPYVDSYQPPEDDYEDWATKRRA
ncbi:DUF3073 family protein [Kineococcus sp. R8]|uniref:DUF3073 domain-containing protein n=1 Tax=Kineococcus siccus TaxID=2696567 RepID=UPI001411F56C|nr:DUF3073 domain-containing protein [Kineococcus siccus]NAZ80387.1 DUF3073 family protein [Kineococcus siccus]